MADVTTLSTEKTTTNVATWESFEMEIAKEISENPLLYRFIRNPELLARNTITFLKGNKDLLQFCKENGKSKFKAAVLESARMGLDATKKEVYLIPRKTNLDCTPSYIGMRNLVRRHSVRPVKDVYAEVVRDGDVLEYEFSDGKYTYMFKPKPFSTAPFVGAFAVIEFEDGGNRFETINEEELQTIKSKTQNKGYVWKDFPGEMRKKAVIRRIAKGIQIDYDEVTGLQEYLDEDMKINTSPSSEEVTDVYADAEVVES